MSSFHINDGFLPLIRTIHFDVSKPYDVYVGKGIFHAVPKIIRPLCGNQKVSIITDDIVDGLYGMSLMDSLITEGYDVVKYSFPNGEPSKNISTLSDVLEFLARQNFKRNDWIIALGGGVVGDLAGFASAIYMRGINYIQIPTTLLAMVDSSIGGKTAVDLMSGKNLVGSFWQPSLVICDLEIANELPPSIFQEGMGEVLKYGVIGCPTIFGASSRGEISNSLESVICDCINLKRLFVEKDEFETKGCRKILNVGHTFAHGLEKASDYLIPHGFAVGTGLVWEAGISLALGFCTETTFNSIKEAVLNWNLLLDVKYEFSELVNLMKKDKKNDDSLISFMLPIDLGNCVEKKISGESLIAILEKVKGLI